MNRGVMVLPTELVIELITDRLENISHIMLNKLGHIVFMYQL